MTTRVDQLSAATSIASTDLIVVEQGGVLKQATPALLPFAPSGTGAVERPSQTKLRELGLCPEDFGAVGDGTTNDLTALTNWLNAVQASGSKVGYMQAKTYGISADLPTINTSGVRIYGAGAFGNHNAPSANTVTGSVIKAISGNTIATMLTIAPTESASAAFLFGIEIIGITLNCSNSAPKGLVTKSMRFCKFDICVLGATTTGWEMNVSTTLGDSTSSQMNTIRYSGRQNTSGGVSLRLMGDANGNPSFNHFEYVDIVHKNDIGIIEENADNNLWEIVRISQVAGGSATNSIEWRGGATAGVSCRNETFVNLSSTLAPIAKGTGTYTVGAADIQVVCLDKGNSTPAITVESGSTASYGYLSGSKQVIGYGSVDTFTISASGIAVKGLVDLSDATSGQIKFPATANPSANANTMDDYEEGSWTAALEGSSTAGTQTYSSRASEYTKIGNKVLYSSSMILSAKDGTTSGNLQISGIPFASAGGSVARYSAAVGPYSNIDINAAGGYTHMTAAISGNGATVILLTECGDNVAFASLTEADFGNTTAIRVSGQYQAT